MVQTHALCALVNENCCESSTGDARAFCGILERSSMVAIAEKIPGRIAFVLEEEEAKQTASWLSRLVRKKERRALRLTSQEGVLWCCFGDDEAALCAPLSALVESDGAVLLDSSWFLEWLRSSASLHFDSAVEEGKTSAPIPVLSVQKEPYVAQWAATELLRIVVSVTAAMSTDQTRVQIG